MWVTCERAHIKKAVPVFVQTEALMLHMRCGWHVAAGRGRSSGPDDLDKAKCEREGG